MDVQVNLQHGLYFRFFFFFSSGGLSITRVAQPSIPEDSALIDFLRRDTIPPQKIKSLPRPVGAVESFAAATVPRIIPLYVETWHYVQTRVHFILSL